MVHVLKCRQFIIDYINSKAKPAITFNLTDAEWEVVEEVVSMLEIPFYATKMLQTTEYTLSDFHVEWLLLMNGIDKRASTLSAVENDFPNQLLNSLRKYSSQLLTNPMYAAAIFLDPRFTKTLNITTRTLAISKMMRIWERINQSKEAQHQIPATDKEETFCRFDELEKLLAAAEAVNPNAFTSNEDGIHHILEKFANLPREKPSTNVLQYWEKNKEENPELFL